MEKINNITEYTILQDNVLVEAINVEEKDGIYTPVGYDDKAYLGKVISVGNGRLLETGARTEMVVKVNDVVYFNKYSSTKFNLDGKDYYTIREEDVIAYLR